MTWSCFPDCLATGWEEHTPKASEQIADTPLFSIPTPWTGPHFPRLSGSCLRKAHLKPVSSLPLRPFLAYQHHDLVMIFLDNCGHGLSSHWAVWHEMPHFLSCKSFMPGPYFLSGLSFQPEVQRRFELCIPRNQTARPDSHFPYSYICERFVYFQDRSWYYINRSQIYECRSCGTEAAQFPFWEYFFQFSVQFLCSVRFQQYEASDLWDNDHFSVNKSPRPGPDFPGLSRGSLSNAYLKPVSSVAMHHFSAWESSSIMIRSSFSQTALLLFHAPIS